MIFCFWFDLFLFSIFFWFFFPFYVFRFFNLHFFSLFFFWPFFLTFFFSFDFCEGSLHSGRPKERHGRSRHRQLWRVRPLWLMRSSRREWRLHSEWHLFFLETCQNRLARRLLAMTRRNWDSNPRKRQISNREMHLKVGIVPVAMERRIRRAGWAKSMGEQIQNDHHFSSTTVGKTGQVSEHDEWREATCPMGKAFSRWHLSAEGFWQRRRFCARSERRLEQGFLAASRIFLCTWPKRDSSKVLEQSHPATRKAPRTRQSAWESNAHNVPAQMVEKRGREVHGILWITHRKSGATARIHAAEAFRSRRCFVNRSAWAC